MVREFPLRETELCSTRGTPNAAAFLVCLFHIGFSIRPTLHRNVSHRTLGGLSGKRWSHRQLACAGAQPRLQENGLSLTSSGPSSRSGPSLRRGAGDHLLWKMPAGLGCPLWRLPRPKAVLTVQMPAAPRPPAPVAQPPASISILHWPLLMSPRKSPLPQKHVNVLDFPEDPTGDLEGIYLTRFDIFVKRCSFLSQFSDHSSCCCLGLRIPNLCPPRAQAHGTSLHPGLPHATLLLLTEGEQIPSSPGAGPHSSWPQRPAAAPKEPPLPDPPPAVPSRRCKNPLSLHLYTCMGGGWRQHQTRVQERAGPAPPEEEVLSVSVPRGQAGRGGQHLAPQP